jgi:hypothetical protein
VDGRYSFLKPKDVIEIGDHQNETEKEYIQITQIFRSKIKNQLEDPVDSWKTKNIVQTQLERECKEYEEVNVYEFRRFYKSQLEDN